MKKTIRKTNILALSIASFALVAGIVFAANNATFKLTINPGSLGVDIVDNTYTTIESPEVYFNAVSSSLDCASTTGILGTSSEQIYITNPDAADNGYTVTLGATDPISGAWSDNDVANGVNTFAYNNEAGSGCDAGQLTISGGTISDGKLASDSTTGIVTVGGAFTTAVSSVTLISASAGSADISEVVATDFLLTQQIPARTPASSYSLPMTLTIMGNL